MEQRLAAQVAPDVVDEDVDRGGLQLRRVPRDVRGHPDLRVLVQPMPSGSGSGSTVSSVAMRDDPVVERDAQRVLVDERAAGDVHEVHARRHLRERVRVDQVPRARGRGRGEHDVRGARQQLVERVHDLHAGAPGSARRCAASARTCIPNA